MLKAATTASALGRGRNCRSSWKEARAKALSEPKMTNQGNCDGLFTDKQSWRYAIEA
jgi:hypothetical protein